jgi:GTP cyclohydrolase IA
MGAEVNMNKKRVAGLVRQLIKEMGEDPTREGLLKTPDRVAEAYSFLTSGYKTSAKRVINNALFMAEANNMVLLKNVEVYSLCEHHMLPFFGSCHIGYIPRKKVIGVSKLARIVDVYSRRLQIQERLTAQIAKDIMDTINPEGVGVVMECRHLCMIMRGVEKQDSVMMTSSVLGSFHNDTSTRAEFLSLVAK